MAKAKDQTSEHLFDKKKTFRTYLDSFFYSGFALCTYFIVICALAIFGKIFVEGAPVLYSKGLGFLTTKPETLCVLEVQKGEKIIAPVESFENMMRGNPGDFPVVDVVDTVRSQTEVTFDLMPGSLIGKGYLLDLEKENSGFYLKYDGRVVSSKAGLTLPEDKKFNLPEEKYNQIVASSPALIVGDVEFAEGAKIIKTVTVDKGEYPIRQAAYQALEQTDFIFQMKASFADDDRESKTIVCVVPETQVVQLPSTLYYAAFDEEEPGTIPVLNEKTMREPVKFVSFTLPKGSYQLSRNALDILASYGAPTLHEVGKGYIKNNEVDPVRLTLSKEKFERLVSDNPECKLENVQEKTVEAAYKSFSFSKDCELQLNVSDYNAITKANNQEPENNFNISKEQTHSYSGGGILGPIVGTALLVIICMIVALFTGISAAVFLNEYAWKGGFVKVIRLAMLNLAGVPSIVFGLFGLGLFVMLAPVVTSTPKTKSEITLPITIPFSGLKFGKEPGERVIEEEKIAVVPKDFSAERSINYAVSSNHERFYNGHLYLAFQGWGTCMLAGGFTLAIMVLPVIVTASEESLKSVPMGFREASLALGASKWQSIRTVVLPYAMPGILTASVLGITRVAGETAPIMFTAAAAEKSSMPWDGIHSSGFGYFIDFLQESVQALPYHIFTVAARIPQSEHTESMQYGAVLVFMIIVLLLSLLSIVLRAHVRKKYKW